MIPENPIEPLNLELLNSFSLERFERLERFEPRHCGGKLNVDMSGSLVDIAADLD
jgi:hypothetical protein